jgi:hypothetical protein
VTWNSASYRLSRVGAKPFLEVRRPGAEPESFAVDPDWANPIFQESFARDVPAVPSSGVIGVGGGTFGITFVYGINRSEFTWWRTAPEGWEPLANLVGRIVAKGTQLARFYPPGSE